MPRSPIAKQHRLAVARAWEGDEPLSEFMQRWVETGEAKSSAARRIRLDRLAQLVADAEGAGAAAQQQLITSLLFGGFVEGPLVDEAIALSKRVNEARKAESRGELRASERQGGEVTGIGDAGLLEAERLRWVQTGVCPSCGYGPVIALPAPSADAAMTRWVPVTERLPEPDKLVQVYGGVAYWNGYRWFTPLSDGREVQWPVTHWAPLLAVPKPPERP